MNAPPNPNELLVRLLGLRARCNLDTPSSVYLKLESATRHGHVSILTDRHGRPCGYVAFARLNKESFVRFRHHGELPENAWEWNEGYLVVVADCMWKRIELAELLRQLREAVGRVRVVGYRRDEGIKICTRQHKIFRLAEIKLLAGVRAVPEN
jgi:hypothetical protein